MPCISSETLRISPASSYADVPPRFSVIAGVRIFILTASGFKPYFSRS